MGVLKTLLVFFVAFSTMISGIVGEGLSEEEADRMTVSDLIQSHGYPSEEHFVTTEDGYILLIHRIPHYDQQLYQQDTAPVVLLAHGALASSAQWVLGNSSNSLGYLLSDNGFDVWMLNFRGNMYSRNHTSIDPEHQKFWDFSWDEMGTLDLPAIIDYILSITGESKLNYVGHSMGTTSFFAGMSVNPEYNDKINHMIAWAPAVYFRFDANPIERMLSAGYLEILGSYIVTNGNGDYMGRWSLKSEAYRLYAKESTWPWLVTVSGWVGGNPFYFDHDLKMVFIYNFPVGLSMKAMAHYAQSINNGKFRRYDELPLENMVRYRSLLSPEYDLSKVTARVTLMEARGDLLCSKLDIDILENALPNVAERYIIKRGTFGHLSYLVENDVGKQVLKPTLKRLLKANKDRAQ